MSSLGRITHSVRLQSQNYEGRFLHHSVTLITYLNALFCEPRRVVISATSVCSHTGRTVSSTPSAKLPLSVSRASFQLFLRKHGWGCVRGQSGLPRYSGFLGESPLKPHVFLRVGSDINSGSRLPSFLAFLYALAIEDTSLTTATLVECLPPLQGKYRHPASRCTLRCCWRAQTQDVPTTTAHSWRCAYAGPVRLLRLIVALRRTPPTTIASPVLQTMP